MKLYNRVAVLITLLCVCLLVATACGNNAENPESTAGTTVPKTGTTAENTSAAPTAQTQTQAVTGEENNISIEVVFEDGSSKIFPLTTKYTNLADALTDCGLASGRTEQYGFVIYTVDGVTADFTVSNAYWAISVNGEVAQTGASEIVLENGSVYTLTYSTY